MKTKIIAQPRKSPAKKKLANQCRFAFSDARSCAMPRWNRHPNYCLFHARQEQQILDADNVGQELSGFTGEIRTNVELNRALSSLFKALAQNRIPTRNAAVLAYIGQLLQKTISDAQDELYKIDGNDAVKDLVRDALDAHDGRAREEEEEDEEENDSEETEVAEDDDNEADEEGDRVSERIPAVARAKPPAPTGYRFHPNHNGGIWVPINQTPNDEQRNPNAPEKPRETATADPSPSFATNARPGSG
jgi:hypothetical protein